MAAATRGSEVAHASPQRALHHFDRGSLVALLEHNGFECLTPNSFEDGIRLRPGEAARTFYLGF
ncbi:hypothetical protein [Mesorhizobium sp. WSM3873]|uniref:hypothetical protein n=1 Tax=Mesorhizobium sp. WSM3873 TaxID=1854056 RepID=UPI001FD8C080|nr:hypothetical protein [Mesorhizobium sp. WSM3873]